MTMATTNAPEKQPVQIKISDIIKMLDNGQDRKQIAKHYGLTQATVKRLFEHPQLKNRRVKPTVPVELIDDVTVEGSAVTETVAPVVEAPAATQEAAPAAETNAAPVTAATSTDKGVW